MANRQVHSRANTLLDAGLNLVWPGLGQLHQGRTGPGLYFGVESLALVAAFVWAPTWRPLLVVVFVAIALWAIADATVVARRRDLEDGASAG